jgi:hypothetical protein
MLQNVFANLSSEEENQQLRGKKTTTRYTRLTGKARST